MRRPHLRSLRARLIALVVALVVAALLLLASVSALVLRENLWTQAEDTLYLANESAQAQVVNALEQTGELSSLTRSEVALPYDGFYAVFGTGGLPQSALFARDYDTKALPSAALTQLPDVPGLLDGTQSISIDGLGEYLVLGSAFTADDGSAYIVVSGVGLTEPFAVVRLQWLTTSALGLLIAALATGLGYRLVRRELEPLEHVASIAEQVARTPMSSGEVLPQGRVPRSERRAGSEIDRVAEALNALLTNLEQSMNARHRGEESMRRFIAEASHELRNPLASIRGYADFYSQPGADPAETMLALGRINAEATRMSSLVSDLLLLARLDADPHVRHDEVELTRLVAETVSDARFAYPNHSWSLVLPDQAVQLRGDEDALRQMLLNLTGNAGHHTPGGTRVEVVLHSDGPAWRLSVRDDGPGIPEDALPTLFDRFTQAGRDGGEVRERTTVGLGLAIVQALAAASGFGIEVETTRSGTCFTIHIPGKAEVPDARGTNGEKPRQ